MVAAYAHSLVPRPFLVLISCEARDICSYNGYIPFKIETRVLKCPGE